MLPQWNYNYITAYVVHKISVDNLNFKILDMHRKCIDEDAKEKITHNYKQCNKVFYLDNSYVATKTAS